MTGSCVLNRTPATTWEHIPPEILECILHRLDLSSLLALSKLSRTLNQIALAIFFGAEKLHELTRAHTFCLGPSDNGPELLRALSSSLWIKTVRHIEWSISTSRESHQLAAVIAASPQIDTLTMTLCGPLARNMYSRSFLVPWTDVVEAALTRGCKSLSLKCLNADPESKHDFHDALGYSARSITRRLSSWFRRHVLQERGPLNPSHMPENSPLLHVPIYSSPHYHQSANLQELSIDSPSLRLNPLASAYLRSILLRQASTIRRLSIGGSDHLCDDAWDQLFKGVHLPRLESLRIGFSMWSQKLLPFLYRHPTITRFSIVAIEPVGRPKRSPVCLLPNLVQLSAAPDTITYLLSTPRSFTKLQSVQIRRESRTKNRFASVARALHAIISTPSPSPLHITADFPLPNITTHYSSLQSHFDHIGRDRSYPRPRRLPDKQRVIELALDMSPPWWIDESIVERGLDAIVGWLSQFCSLRALHIKNPIFRRSEANQRFTDAVQAVCPSLGVFHYGSQVLVDEKLKESRQEESPLPWEWSAQEELDFMAIRKEARAQFYRECCSRSMTTLV